MANELKKDVNEFIETLTKYVKHQGIELELTLKDEKKVYVNRNRFLDGNELVQFYGDKETSRIHLTKIKKAEIFVY